MKLRLGVIDAARTTTMTMSPRRSMVSPRLCRICRQDQPASQYRYSLQKVKFPPPKVPFRGNKIEILPKFYGFVSCASSAPQVCSV